MFRLITLVLIAAVWSSDLCAQDDSSETTELTEVEVQTVLDDALFVSPRAAGMGGAISTLADGLDAAYYNPAGIGGLDWGKKKVPYIRKLYFPHIGVSANENTRKLNDDFGSAGGSEDKTVGQNLVDAASGQRQYGRVTSVLGLVFGRMMVVPFSDVQMAAVSQGEEGAIDIHYRSISGVGTGFSASDPKERFYLGYFAASIDRADTTGEFAYLDIINTETRSEVMKEATKKYSGVSQNVGFIWKIAKKAAPKLSLVSRNMGGTTYKAKDTSGETDNIVVRPDLTAGLSVSPKLGKEGQFNFIMEAGYLDDNDVTLSKKWRLGMEYLYGGFGSYSMLGLRAGANSAGASYGLNLHIGIITIAGSSQAEDIGVDNAKVIERRSVASITVDIADF